MHTERVRAKIVAAEHPSGIADIENRRMEQREKDCPRNEGEEKAIDRAAHEVRLRTGGQRYG